MRKLESLTPQQERLMHEVWDEWLFRFFSCQTKLEKQTASEGIKWLYELSGRKAPFITYLTSPLECQYHYKLLAEPTNIKDNMSKTIKQHVKNKAAGIIETKVSDQLIARIEAAIWDKVGTHVWDNVGFIVKNNLKVTVKERMEFAPFSVYGNVGDYCWVACYDFFSRIGVLQDENFNRYMKFIKSGIYDMIQLDGQCLVCELPSKVSLDEEGKLHGETDTAIEWRDAYGQYYWNGVPVPRKLIEYPEHIVKDDIVNEPDVEVRRAIRERIGKDKFMALMDIQALDVDILNGEEYTLYRSKEIDSAIHEYLYWVKVCCHSTNREYFLSVPPVGSALEAVAWTFGKTKEEYAPDIEA